MSNLKFVIAMFTKGIELRDIGQKVLWAGADRGWVVEALEVQRRVARVERDEAGNSRLDSRPCPSHRASVETRAGPRSGDRKTRTRPLRCRARLHLPCHVTKQPRPSRGENRIA